MNRFIQACLAPILALAPVGAMAYENIAVEGEVQECYSRAMIGMDSVINARMGVPAEHALSLSLKPGVIVTNEHAYRKDFLIVILDAYLWDESPHSYALKVFYNCAAANRQLHSASAAATP